MVDDDTLRHQFFVVLVMFFVAVCGTKSGIALNSYSFQILSIALLGLGLGHPAVAQPSQISLSLQGEDITGISIETETAPADDSVLLEAPDQLQLEFAYDVRLVKLTLRNGLRDWVDIDFRYDPTIQEKFQWNIPELTQATYYTADWAILATNDRLIRGSFSFSFGPEAQAPSVTKAAEALVLDSISAGPNTRFVRPPQSLDSSVEPR